MVTVAADPREDYLLRLGDDALDPRPAARRMVRRMRRCSKSIVSLANLALDLIGQATLLLGAAGDADRLAFHRDVLDFRNCLLVEQPNGDFAQTIARQLLFSTWQHMLLAAADRVERPVPRANSPPRRSRRSPTIASWRASGRSGSATGPRKARGGWPRGSTGAGASFPSCSRSTRRCRRRSIAGIAPDPRDFEEEYRSAIAAVLAEAQLEAPADQRPILGGRRGHHSEHLGHMLAAMQFLPRTYPDATW